MDRGYEELDVPYSRVEGRELVLRITRPAGGPASELRDGALHPVLLDFHGGAWTHFDHRVDLAWCRELARAGVVCASVQFRQAPEHPWPTFLADARTALRWLTAHGMSVGADVGRLGTIGGSTGGFLSILLALCPAREDEAPTPALDTPDSLPPAAPRVGIGFYPILDVVGRYHMVSNPQCSPATRWLRERLGPRRPEAGHHLPSPIERLEALHRIKHQNPRLGAFLGSLVNGAVAAAGRLPPVRLAIHEELALAHRGAFRDVDEMQRASPLARVQEGRIQQRPPLLVLQGRDDVNVTAEMAESFAAAYRARGGEIDLELPAGFPHAFASVPSPQSDHAIARSLAFLAAHGLLDRDDPARSAAATAATSTAGPAR